MRIMFFASRNFKEMLRDPLVIAFSLGFPVVLLLLLSAIQYNIPVELFAISKLAPGITIFGLSFMSLFTATIISKDRGSSFLQRLYTTPMTAFDFLLGYVLPVIPIAVMQSAVCYLVAIFLGLDITVNILIAILFIAVISLLFISIGLLCGSVLNDKQVGGICGALLTNLCAWLSGVWFDLSLVGGAFEKIAHMLPFYHAVKIEQAVINGCFDGIITHFAWVFGYAIVIFMLSAFFFIRQMKKY